MVGTLLTLFVPRGFLPKWREEEDGDGGKDIVAIM